MDNTDYPFLVDEWLREERAKFKRSSKNFIGDRPYRHFDGRVGIASLESNESRLVPLLKQPELLKRHSFLPFIRKDKRVRRFRVDKNTQKPEIAQKARPIMYASHRDACIYGFYSFLLKRRYEDRINKTALAESILAYRHIERNDESGRGKSNIDFAKETYELVKKYERAAVLCLDIEKFFDRMNHQLIKQRWATLLGVDELPPGHYAVFRNITNFRYVFLHEALKKLGYGKLLKGKFVYNQGASRRGILCFPDDYRTKIATKGASLIHKNTGVKGIPQGSPISDIIANFYLEDFDRDVLAALDELGFGVYRRYSDDILIVCPEDKAKDVYDFICERIKQEKLTIKPGKTEAIVIDNKSQQIADITHQVTGEISHTSSNRQAFQYLGFEIDAHDLHVRAGTVAMHYRRAKRKAKVTAAKSAAPVKKKKRAGDNRKNRSRWQYFINSKRRTGSNRIKAQLNKMLRRVRSFSSQG